MSDIKKKSGNMLHRTAVLFLILALLLQIMLLVFATTDGMAGVYPYYLAMASRRIDTTDNGVGEYYSLRDVAENSRVVVLAVDEYVVDSYVLAADLLNFLDRFADVSRVGVYTSRTALTNMSTAIVNGNRESFDIAVERQREIGVISNEAIEFFEYCFQLNKRLSPQNKISLVGVKGLTGNNSVLNSIINTIYITPGATTEEHMELTRITDEVEFAERFISLEETLRPVFGNDYDKYAELCRAMEEDRVPEVSTAQNTVKLVPPDEGTAFLVMPRSICGEDSLFVKALRENFGEVTVLSCSYYDSKTVVDGQVCARNDGPYPFFADGIRIADKNELSGFRAYYSSLCTGLSPEKREREMARIGEAGECSFFIICGSEAVTFGAPEETETETAAKTEAESSADDTGVITVAG